MACIFFFVFIPLLQMVATTDNDELATSFQLDDSIMVTSLGHTECSRAGWSCSGCHSTRLCRRDGGGLFVEVMTKKCVSPMNYCQLRTGTCGNEQNEEICGEEDYFVCLKANGYFPDANDTRVYHVCTDFEPTKFRCKGSYDPYRQTCTPASVEGFNRCYHSNEGQFVRNLEHPRYYGICLEGKVDYVDRCPPQYDLDETEQRCILNCTNKLGNFKEGVNATNVDDCSTYYTCKSGRPVIYNCPDREEFFTKYGKCLYYWYSGKERPCSDDNK